MNDLLSVFVLLVVVVFLMLSRWSRMKAPSTNQERNPDKIVHDYLDSGLRFGSAVSDLSLGQCIGFETLLKSWSICEEQYARLGYRTISIDAFEGCAGWGYPIEDLVKQKRDDGEETILHANLYAIFFLNQIGPSINTKQLMSDGKAQFGTYFVPTTEGLVKALRSMRERDSSLYGLSIMQVAEAIRARKEAKDN